MNYLLLIIIFIPLILTQAFYWYKIKSLEQKGVILLDEKVDEVILTLRKEIPMGETLLKGALIERIKEKAKGLVRGLIPEFKQKAESSYSLIFIPWVFVLLTWMVAVWFF